MEIQCTFGHGPAITRKKKRSQVVARNGMIAHQGFAWIAREPELISGAEGAHIRTEISRLAQPVLNLP